MDAHRIDSDTDSCACGGQIVYFEDGDDKGEIGHGCEAAGLVFSDERQKERGR